MKLDFLNKQHLRAACLGQSGPASRVVDLLRVEKFATAIASNDGDMSEEVLAAYVVGCMDYCQICMCLNSLSSLSDGMMSTLR